MALFKKACSICGEAGGLISSKKLQDGVICGDCQKKLSPFFDGVKEATTRDINAQLAYREENQQALATFTPTKAWGVKKYGPAMQFIYDEEKRAFVVVPGPEESFKEKNPDIISFDQVKAIRLEIDEYWTEGKGEFEARQYNQNLLQEDYDEVYWRYDFYLHFDTTHPYAGNFKYQMNFKPTIMQVPQHGIVFKRGLEIGGTYEGEDIDILEARLAAFGEKEENWAERQKVIDAFLLHNKGKGTLEAIKDDLIRDGKNALYFKKIANMGAHVARARRIRKLVLGS